MAAGSMKENALTSKRHLSYWNKENPLIAQNSGPKLRRAECFLLLCCALQGGRFGMTSMQSQSELRETKTGGSDSRPYGSHGISTKSTVSSHELYISGTSGMPRQYFF